VFRDSREITLLQTSRIQSVLHNLSRKVFEKKAVWNMALYVEDGPVSLDSSFRHPRKVFSSKRPHLFERGPHTQADPFLFVLNEELYIFFEIVIPGGVGKIAVYRTRDFREFEYIGIILDESYHLSFPFVFSCDNHIYMLPETSSANEIMLYKFANFPFGLKKNRTLLYGRYCDSFVLRKQDTWFLFTTSEKGLEIYYSDCLLNENFIPHPSNPISIDPQFRRSGGGPICMGGELYRVSQDCSETYGRNISFIKILELSKISYIEEVTRKNFIELTEYWNTDGSHHFSAVSFNNRYVVMVDGKCSDYFFNRLTSVLNRTFPALLLRARRLAPLART
jgi:hypothetical protein